VPPVVIVRPTDRIELIRVLVLDGLLPQAILNLKGGELEMVLTPRQNWLGCAASLFFLYDCQNSSVIDARFNG
jgi:hypothetical protein